MALGCGRHAPLTTPADAAPPVAIDARPVVPDGKAAAPDLAVSPEPDAAVTLEPDAAVTVPPDTAPDTSFTPDTPGDCGRAGEICCPGLECVAPETVCVGADPATATCQPCGRSIGTERRPCCRGNSCLDGGCCIHLVSGNIGPSCVSVGSLCWELGSVCTASGSCRPGCGGPHQPCCRGLNTDYCSASGTACLRAAGAANDSCLPCGQAGQPCCRAVLSQYSIEPCAPSLRCTADLCSP
jgi:hypothetical protein